MILSEAVAALDDTAVWRPAAHLERSDCSFISADKKSGFALHSFVLKLRSPVFAAILESLGAGDEPLELPEKGVDLKTFFQALYANDPYKLLTADNVVAVCRLSHKYATAELGTTASATLKRMAKNSRLSGTVPTIPEILLVVRNPALLFTPVHSLDRSPKHPFTPTKMFRPKKHRTIVCWHKSSRKGWLPGSLCLQRHD
jgi:hypothetical protein